MQILSGAELKVLLGGLMAGAGALCFWAVAADLKAGRVAEEIIRDGDADRLDEVTTFGTTAPFEEIARAALAADPEDLPLARSASLKTLALDPSHAAAWNRLAYVDVAANGRLTREGLSALYRSYEVAPWDEASVMMWRVDFGARLWDSLPFDLRQRTVGQIPVIARMPETWEWRIDTCRHNPVAAVHESACSTVTGVRHLGADG